MADADDTAKAVAATRARVKRANQEAAAKTGRTISDPLKPPASKSKSSS